MQPCLSGSDPKGRNLVIATFPFHSRLRPWLDNTVTSSRSRRVIVKPGRVTKGLAPTPHQGRFLILPSLYLAQFRFRTQAEPGFIFREEKKWGGYDEKEQEYFNNC